LKNAGYRPQRAIELIIFTAEEPTRFGIGCIGSRLLSGMMDPEKAASARDRDGKTLETWRHEAGCTGGLETVPLARNVYAGFVELHIEQGPVLERENTAIGIVEKIAAPSTLRMQLTGVGGHAGAVLMPERHDAGLAGAEIALAVEQAVTATGSQDTVGTTGVFRIEPGAVNSVPCAAWLEIDVRDTRVATRDQALAQIEAAAAQICRRRGVTLQTERLNVDAPAICDSMLVETIAALCQQAGISHKKMISRAYHDTLFMAQLCRSTMIFIPCRGGFSHRPDEFSSPEQIETGVTILAQVLAELSGNLSFET
jgi:N-carbamoyl-L-amino-acid hydrolase